MTLRLHIVGTGRLGCSLGVALMGVGEVSVCGATYHSRQGRDRARRWLPAVPLGELAKPPGLAEADLVVLAVRDDVISSVAESLAPRLTPRQVTLHTSGLLDAEPLRAARLPGPVGSFHPLQTFADPASAADRFRGCVVGCEGDEAALDAAESLAQALGARAQRLTAGGKVAYHAAAVVASNYLVVLAEMAARLAKVAGISEDRALAMLRPLQEGTLANLAEVGLPTALTGPIARADVETVQAHLATITAHIPDLRPAYVELARLALELARKQGQDEGALDAIARLLGTPSP